MTKYKIDLPSNLPPVETINRIRAVQDYLQSQEPVPENKYNGFWNKDGIYEIRFPVYQRPMSREEKVICELLWKGDTLILDSMDMEVTEEMKESIDGLLFGSE